jgi:hypothetical protein
MKRKRKINGPFVPLPLVILDAPAWRAMDFIARALWIELRRKLRNDGLNNGKVWLACRPAAKALGANKETIAYRYAELEHYGFLRKTTEGFLGVDGRGIAPHWRFTDLAHGTHPPTRDFEKWDGELFVYTPRRRQNPVRPRRTPRTAAPDITAPPRYGSLCTAAPDINGPPRCPATPDISRLPLPTAAVGQDQGSSSRAPATAQAGDAGSNPAPDAKPDLTAMVLEIVNAQLDELEQNRARRLEAAR